MGTTDTRPRSAFDRFLSIFADVHSGEGLTAVLLALNVFLILTAYYVLKPVREALILSEGSAELKSYLAAGQVLVLSLGVPLGVVFFVWIGIFSLMIIAQFWAFANDVYTKEEGERLFVIVGFGASLGAVAGARIADRLIEPLGVYQLMLLGAAILLAQLALTNHINTRENARRPPAARVVSASTT